MKKRLSLIFICIIFLFTACTKKASTPDNVTEEKAAEMETENRLDRPEKTEDEKYLTDLAAQLNLGMDIDEVFFRLGEPDFGKNSSSLLNVIYQRGEYDLCIQGPIVSGAFVTNRKTGQETVIKLSRPEPSESRKGSYKESDIVNLGKQIESDMTEKDVTDKLGEPDEKIGSELSWLKYHYGNYTLYIDIWNAKDKVYRVRVYDYENNKNTQIYVSDEPIIA